jgi:AcrR family transcriptional regulator
MLDAGATRDTGVGRMTTMGPDPDRVDEHADVPEDERPAFGEGPEGRRHLLAAAMEVVADAGSAALRMTDVAERAGVSFALIAHHFSNREGLVAAAQAELFRGALEQDHAATEAVVTAASDTDALVDALRDITAAVLSPERADVRLRRVAALGTAHGPAKSRTTISHVATDSIDRVTRIVEDGQARGLIRDDLDARAVATFTQAYALGLVLADLDVMEPDRDELARVIDAVIATLVRPPATG